ncbi:MAG: hypothetical protein ACPLQO_11155 [Desulfotomaculales bacterium]
MKLEEAKRQGRIPTTIKNWERELKRAKREEEKEKIRQWEELKRRENETEAGDKWWEAAKVAVCLYSKNHSCIIFGERKHVTCYAANRSGEHTIVEHDTPLWKERSICSSAGFCRFWREDVSENLDIRNSNAGR